MEKEGVKRLPFPLQLQGAVATMVPVMGSKPTRCFQYRILSPTRLPLAERAMRANATERKRSIPPHRYKKTQAATTCALWCWWRDLSLQSKVSEVKRSATLFRYRTHKNPKAAMEKEGVKTSSFSIATTKRCCRYGAGGGT